MITARSLLLSSFCLLSSVTYAQYQPSEQPVRLILSTPAGGGSDTAARAVAEQLAPVIKRSVVVENRPGAGGMLAASAVARSPADGTTLLVSSVSASPAAPLLFGNMSYKPEELVPVYRLVSAPLVVLVPSNSPFKTFNDFVDAARKANGEINFGTYTMPTHAAMEVLSDNLKFKTKTVNYKTSAQVMTDLSAGRLDVSVIDLASSTPMLQGKRLRALALVQRERSKLAPDIPTVYEFGYSGNEIINWIGIFAPVGTPEAITTQLSTELQKIATAPAMRERLHRGNLEVVEDGTPPSFRKFLQSELEAYKTFVQRTNYVPQ